MGRYSNHRRINMLHGLDISIAQMAGRKKGVYVTEPVDIIYASQGGSVRKIGFISRCHNGKVCLIRHLRPELRQEVRDEVERLRLAEPEGYTVAARTSSVPDPKLIKAYIKGELKKPAPTTIVRPDGELFVPPEPEEDDEDE